MAVQGEVLPTESLVAGGQTAFVKESSWTSESSVLLPEPAPAIQPIDIESFKSPSVKEWIKNFMQSNITYNDYKLDYEPLDVKDTSDVWKSAYVRFDMLFADEDHNSSIKTIRRKLKSGKTPTQQNTSETTTSSDKTSSGAEADIPTSNCEKNEPVTDAPIPNREKNKPVTDAPTPNCEKNKPVTDVSTHDYVNIDPTTRGTIDKQPFNMDEWVKEFCEQQKAELRRKKRHIRMRKPLKAVARRINEQLRPIAEDVEESDDDSQETSPIISKKDDIVQPIDQAQEDGNKLTKRKKAIKVFKYVRRAIERRIKM